MQKSSDIFDMLANHTKPNFKGFSAAQSRYDNMSPEYEEEPETPEEEVEAFKAYKFAMELAIKGLTQQIEVFKKYKKNETADLLEIDVDEIVAEIARRESKIV